MSLLPPSPRYAGPRPRGWAARDALEPAWRQWCALVDSRKVSFAMRATERAVSELVSAAVAPPGPRIALALAWKHWRHFLAMRRAAPYLAGTLVERECAVVAFKAWRRATRGRPVAYEIPSWCAGKRGVSQPRRCDANDTPRRTLSLANSARDATPRSDDTTTPTSAPCAARTSRVSAAADATKTGDSTPSRPPEPGTLTGPGTGTRRSGARGDTS